ncbi:PE family protein [Candidatus Mycobacterium methanotrophicum]|uniref:PE family protein n=1 Tax=Candidatus Mycobacterium methanotrophicum TaxID=2943498 RepID=A0ABY4QRX9_9MYCO|nr:PE family protein [Candidatus Mycobacterium methanotrophicum]UQX13429.1 PE family protein [Candidatus Mycobacterium methanotrophicum]
MLEVNSEALLAGGAAVTGITAQQTAATATAMPVVGALTPAGLDTVSALACAAFNAEGVDFSATSAEGSAMLGLAAEGLFSVGMAYEAVDAAGAAQVL